MPSPAARTMNVISSHVAAVAKPLRERMATARGGWMITALTVSAVAVAFIPAIGFLFSWGIDRYRNGVVADRQKEVLADHYKNQVATTLGVDPNHIGTRELALAAKVNPMVAGAIAKVNQEKDSANRSALLANAAVGAIGPLPGVGGVAKVAMHLGGAVAGVGVSSLFDKDVLTVHDVMEHIDAKQKAGEALVANDVLMLRIAENEKWQKQLKDQNGLAFHKMNEAQQQAVIASMPGGMYAEASESAAKVNSGQMEAQHLLMSGRIAANENNDSSWTSRVGSTRRPTSFVEAQNARATAQGPLVS